MFQIHFKLYVSAVYFLLKFSSSVSSETNISQFNVNDVQQQLTGGLRKANFTMDDAKLLLKNKCVETAGEKDGTEAFANIESGLSILVECINNIVNYTAIQSEVDKASPRGELDVVFNKYCNKRPKAIECFEAFNSKLLPCLDNEERDNQEVFMRIVRSLLNFVCHKGGDQIALFIAEKGPECLESKKEDIQQCVNNTFSGYFPKGGLHNIKSLPKLVMRQKQCEDIVALEACIVARLEHCSEITPANIVESMFRFIKNETICRNTLDVSSMKQSKANKNSNYLAVLLLTFLSLIAALLCH